MRAVVILCLIFSLVFTGFSQCEDGRYADIIFSSATVESDILYGNNIDYQGNEQDLFLDVYQPEGDLEDLRPLVIFAHGGSFVAGSKDGADVVPLCSDFARMGYVTASIQYRLGIAISFFIEQPATEAVIRGFHDMKAAIRFFRKSVEEDGNPYKIDINKIYLAGVSAGGFIALHNGYLDQESEIPPIVDQSADGLTGGVEGDSGNSGYSSEIHGVVNICGALADTAYMATGDVPVVSFHGPNDAIVPYGSDTQTLGGFPVVEVDGSESIDIKADELGIENCFEIYEDQGHVPHVTSVAYYDTTRAIMSNFLSHLVCPDIDLNCDYTEIFIVGVEEQLKNTNLHIYPNPAKDEVFVLVPQSVTESRIQILDHLGRVVYTSKISAMQDRIEIALGDLENGNYLIRWKDSQQSRTERLVIYH